MLLNTTDHCTFFLFVKLICFDLLSFNLILHSFGHSLIEFATHWNFLIVSFSFFLLLLSSVFFRQTICGKRKLYNWYMREPRALPCLGVFNSLQHFYGRLFVCLVFWPYVYFNFVSSKWALCSTYYLSSYTTLCGVHALIYFDALSLLV